MPTIHIPELHLGANLDARQPESSPVEAKLVSAHMADGWGEEHSEQIPDAYALQAQTQLICTGQTLCYVVAYVEGEDDVRIYEVPLLNRAADRIRNVIPEWWQRYVISDVAPPNSLPSEEIIKQLRRVPNKVAPVTPEVLSAWRAARAERLAAEKAEEHAKAVLLAQLGDAEAGDGGTAGRVTYFEESNSRIDVSALRAAERVIADRFTVDKPRRVLRDKKSK